MKKTFITFSVVCCVPLVAVIASLLPLWDDARISDDDLLLPPAVTIRDEMNAFSVLPRLSKLSTSTQQLVSETLVTWNNSTSTTRPTPAALEPFVRVTQKAVDEYASATIRPSYQCPAAHTELTSLSSACYWDELRTLGTITTIHAYYHLKIGDTGRAQNLIVANARMGHLLVAQEHPGDILEYYLGQAMFNSFSTIPELQTTVLTDAADTLALYYPNSNDLIRALKKGYMHDKVLLLQGLHQHKPKHGSFWVRSNNTVNLYADFKRREIELVATPCNQTVQTEALAAEITKMKDPLSSALAGNSKGRLLVSLLVNSVGVSLREDLCATVNR